MHFTESRHRVMTKCQNQTVKVKTPISMIIIIEVFPLPFLRTIPRALFPIDIIFHIFDDSPCELTSIIYVFPQYGTGTLTFTTFIPEKSVALPDERFNDEYHKRRTTAKIQSIQQSVF